MGQISSFGDADKSVLDAMSIELVVVYRKSLLFNNIVPKKSSNNETVKYEPIYLIGLCKNW